VGGAQATFGGEPFRFFGFEGSSVEHDIDTTLGQWRLVFHALVGSHHAGRSRRPRAGYDTRPICAGAKPHGNLLR
jgi:hypothetical protein